MRLRIASLHEAEGASLHSAELIYEGLVRFAAEFSVILARHANGTVVFWDSAQNVHDVAWAAAPDFRWDAVSTGPIAGNEKGVLCQAYYVWPRAGRGWEDGAENTQWTIRTYSSLFYPYPYPQATSVAGPRHS